MTLYQNQSHFLDNYIANFLNSYVSSLSKNFILLSTKHSIVAAVGPLLALLKNYPNNFLYESNS